MQELDEAEAHTNPLDETNSSQQDTLSDTLDGDEKSDSQPEDTQVVNTSSDDLTLVLETSDDMVDTSVTTDHSTHLSMLDQESSQASAESSACDDSVPLMVVGSSPCPDDLVTNLDSVSLPVTEVTCDINKPDSPVTMTTDRLDTPIDVPSDPEMSSEDVDEVEAAVANIPTDSSTNEESSTAIVPPSTTSETEEQVQLPMGQLRRRIDDMIDLFIDDPSTDLAANSGNDKAIGSSSQTCASEPSTSNETATEVPVVDAPNQSDQANNDHSDMVPEGDSGRETEDPTQHKVGVTVCGAAMYSSISTYLEPISGDIEHCMTHSRGWCIHCTSQMRCCSRYACTRESGGAMGHATRDGDGEICESSHTQGASEKGLYTSQVDDTNTEEQRRLETTDAPVHPQSAIFDSGLVSAKDKATKDLFEAVQHNCFPESNTECEPIVLSDSEDGDDTAPADNASLYSSGNNSVGSTQIEHPVQANNAYPINSTSSVQIPLHSANTQSKQPLMSLGDSNLRVNNNHANQRAPQMTSTSNHGNGQAGEGFNHLQQISQLVADTTAGAVTTNRCIPSLPPGYNIPPGYRQAVLAMPHTGGMMHNGYPNTPPGFYQYLPHNDRHMNMTTGPRPLQLTNPPRHMFVQRPQVPVMSPQGSNPTSGGLPGISFMLHGGDQRMPPAELQRQIPEGPGLRMGYMPSYPHPVGQVPEAVSSRGQMGVVAMGNPISQPGWYNW